MSEYWAVKTKDDYFWGKAENKIVDPFILNPGISYSYILKRTYEDSLEYTPECSELLGGLINCVPNQKDKLELYETFLRGSGLLDKMLHLLKTDKNFLKKILQEMGPIGLKQKDIITIFPFEKAQTENIKLEDFIQK